MKRRFTILAAAFTLLAFLAIPMGMRGQTTVTFTAGTDTGETSVTKDGITVSMSTMSRTDNYRCYANTDMTVASTVGNITQVVVTCTGSGDANYGPGKFSVPSGEPGTYTYSGFTGTWTGDAVEMTLRASAQVRMTEIAVTYGGVPAPTTYTVTYDCNGGTSDCPENVTGIEAGTAITLAAAPTKTDYTFDGWNDGTTTYQAGASYTVNGNVTMTAQWTEIVSGDEHWVIADLAELTEDDVFVIVGNNGSNYAMSNNNGTGSAPSAVAVTVTGNEITSTVASTIKWTVSGDATNGYTFYPYGSTTTWLYCNTTANSSSNNNMRVGTGDRKVFEMNSDSYLMTKDTYVVRYLSIYNNADWRGYINTNLCPELSFYKKMVGGTVPPSISADNVSVEYDAVSGSIAYTVNNGIDGGVMSATVTEGDWLTLGQGTTSPISFTCTANQTSTVRTATVTLTYTYNRETTTANVTVTQAANPNAVNSISEITANGTYTVQGTIVAKSQRGFIVGDGTGYVYYYNQNYTQADYNIGDMVKLDGSVVAYGGVYEFNSSTTITAATSSNYVAEDPTILSGADMDARVASTTPAQLSNYVQYEGTLSISGTYYNITEIVGATTAKGSISFPISTDFASLDGKHVKVTGYYVGVSSSTYYNTMLGSIEEVTSSNPSIAAEDVSIEFNATSGAITFTINNPVSGGVLTATTESDWLTMGTVGTTVPFTCQANTTASPRIATVTLTYTYNTDQFVNKNVTVTQAGNPSTIDNISDITAAGTYTVQGTIVAISNRGFILGDGTGYVYYYNNTDSFDPADYNIGDDVKLSGSVVVYGGVYEFNNSTEITYVEELNYVQESPIVLTGAEMDARVASTTPPQLSTYVQYEGVLAVSGNYYNINNIEGAQTAKGSISFPLDTEFVSLNGKHVKVTGYYVGISSSQYYNTMIGSVEEVEVQHEQYTLTVSNLVNVNTFVFDATDQNEALLEGEGSVQIYNDTEVMISVDVEEGYALQSLMVDGVNVISQIDETDAYTFFMPAHNVTVTATAVEIIAPTGGDYVRISSLDQLTDGSIVVIASRYDTIATNYFAMKNAIGNKIQGTEFVSQVFGNNEVLPDSIVNHINDYYWVVNVNNNVYTFTNANGDKIGYNSSTNFATNGEKTGWSIAIDTSGMALVPYYEGFVITNTTNTDRGIALRDNNGNKGFGAYSTSNMNGDTYNFFLDFFVQTEATQNVTQTIALAAGTNWVSTNLEITMADLQAALLAALPTAATRSIKIKSQSNGECTNMRNGVWTGNLKVLDVAQMYKITVPSDCEITLEGMPVDPADHPYTVVNGANWIGFPLQEPMSVTNAFAGFPTKNDIVKAQAGGQAKWNNVIWVGALKNLEPGKGYIYNSVATEDRTFTFPANAK